MVEKSAYIESIEKCEDAMRDALEVFVDPFKAPELQVEAAQPVLKAIWDMNVQYAAMIQKGENEKVSEGERS